MPASPFDTPAMRAFKQRLLQAIGAQANAPQGPA
jgi:hypothetical protein